MMRSAGPYFACFVAGVALGAFGVSSYGPAGAAVGHSVREKRQYQFINPLLACEFTESKDARYQATDNQLRAYIKESLLSGRASQVALYTRSGIGSWTGVNENEAFEPASLYKVPVLITYLKLAEADSGILTEQVVFPLPVRSDRQNIQPRERLTTGQTYSIEELLRRMIVYSDNDASLFLLSHIDQPNFDEVFSDLGLPPPSVTDVHKNVITPKQYAFFIRILYNASYLSRVSSEKALQMLSETDFKEGLVAGVPSGTVVAHKFGEFIGSEGASPSLELHDCGIVYAPKHPYTVCIMTEGKNAADLEKVIADISKIVYDGQKLL